MTTQTEVGSQDIPARKAIASVERAREEVTNSVVVSSGAVVSWVVASWEEVNSWVVS